MVRTYINKYLKVQCIRSVKIDFVSGYNIILLYHICANVYECIDHISDS